MSGWMKTALLGAFALAWAAAAFIYLKSMGELDRQYASELRQLVAVTDDAGLREGERLAKIYGCAEACHGEKMAGSVYFEHPLNGRLVAPNLTRLVRARTLPELEATVRQGIKPDGTSVFAMPSAAFATMTDRDLSAVLAYIRSAPEQSSRLPETEHGILTRYRIVSGALPAQAATVYEQPWRETFRNNENRLGEYLAKNACAQCHGLEFEGDGKAVPSLRTINDYDRFEFVALLQRGMRPGDRPLEAKSRMADRRFSLLTESEIDALYLFLKTRPW